MNLVEFKLHLFLVCQQEDLSSARVMMMMIQRFCFVMLFETSTHIMGLLPRIIFSGGTPDVLVQKNSETGVLKQMMRTKYPLHQSYLWPGKLLD